MPRHNKTRRFLAIALSLLLILGVMPAVALAQNSWGGTGLTEVIRNVYLTPQLFAMGNNLLLKDGGSGLTQVFYADAGGNPAESPIDLAALGFSGDANAADLGDTSLYCTMDGTYNGDTNAFLGLDVVVWMQGGTLSSIRSGLISAQARSTTVHMSGGTLTGQSASGWAIQTHALYISGGRIEKNLTAQAACYLSGSPSIGGDGLGIVVGENQKFYLDGALSGASVHVVPNADFADGTVLAEGYNYTITESDLAQIHLTGAFAEGRELYLDGNQIKIRKVSVPSIPYLDETGAQRSLTQPYTCISADNPLTTWQAGWYVAEGKVALNERVTTQGDVKLILKDGASLTVNGGIDVSNASHLTVYAQSTGNGMGALTANGGYQVSGIGGSGGGFITIAGGNITAIGAYRAAGIGGNDNCPGGTVEIYGGSVTATGGSNAAGIGGGAYYEGTDTAVVTIYGGSVTATGGSNAAGIGGGHLANYPEPNGSTITIYDGIVTAIGINGGAGIGGGSCGSGGTIQIHGGNVTATGGSNGGGSNFGENGNGAGIGGGCALYSGVGQDAGAWGGSITITGGIVTASGAVGIGGGTLGSSSGTFSTGESGDAVVFATCIADQSGKNADAWDGLIFEGGQGAVYGTQYTVTEPFTIPEGQVLTVEGGKTLTNSSGFTNNGEIRINMDGVYSGNQPENHVVTYQTNWDSDGDGQTNDTTYTPFDQMPEHADGSKDGDVQYSYTFDRWDPALTAANAPAAYRALFTKSLNEYLVTLPTDGEGYTVETADSMTVPYGGAFTFRVTVQDGYSKTEAFTVSANGSALSAEADGSYRVIVEGNVTITVSGVADITAPQGDIKMQGDSVKKLIHDISFGLFFRENVDVVITAEDAGSGVSSIEYYRSEEVLTQEQVNSIDRWTAYDGVIHETAEDAARFIYYVKITDHAGNITCFGSNGATFDLTPPQITAITDGAVYYTTQQFAVSDANPASVTCNGQTMQQPFTLQGNMNAVYRIEAIDQAGNSIICTVTMKPIESLADSLSGITADHVTSQDKAAIDAVKAAIEALDQTSATTQEKAEVSQLLLKCQTLLDALAQAAQAGNTDNIQKVEDITEDTVQRKDKDDLLLAKEDLEQALASFGDHYTEAEKDALKEKLEQIEHALNSLQRAEAVQDAIAALPDTVEPDDADTAAQIQAVQQQYDALTEHEKSLIPEQSSQKLENLLGDLSDYRIIAGDGSCWTVGSSGSITMTANGPIDKFEGLVLDEKTLDSADYTVRAGSTIITLNPEYLGTLSVGKHTLTFLYQDGEVSGTFEIAASAPQTGDSDNTMLWVAVLLTALCALAATAFCRRKRACGRS
jgi:hypothetical protein